MQLTSALRTYINSELHNISNNLIHPNPYTIQTNTTHLLLIYVSYTYLLQSNIIDIYTISQIQKNTYNSNTNTPTLQPNHKPNLITDIFHTGLATDLMQTIKTTIL